MTDIHLAAQIIQSHWQAGQVLDELDSNCRPQSPEQGYAIQGALATLRGERIVGWKIAATAQAGRDHINVDRPLAGRLYESIVAQDGATIRLGENRMAVAEAEIVFSLKADLPPRPSPYTESEVASRIGSLHPGLEIPDSRFADFTKVGAACLIADNACASQFVIGPPTPEPFDPHALADHPTVLWINGIAASNGHGRDALGGPLLALTWLANTLSALGVTLSAGQFVTTGVTGKPSPIKSGDRVRVDLGRFGAVNATLG